MQHSSSNNSSSSDLDKYDNIRSGTLPNDTRKFYKIDFEDSSFDDIRHNTICQLKKSKSINTDHKKAQDYIKKAFEIIKKHGIKSDLEKINISKLDYKHIKNIPDAYNYVHFILKILNKHSSQIPPMKFKFPEYKESPLTNKPPITKFSPTTGIGYIKINSILYQFGNQKASNDLYKKYVHTTRTTINKWYKTNKLRGFIVDIRGNPGGWVTPMIDSLISILGFGTMFGMSNGKDCVNYLNTFHNYKNVKKTEMNKYFKRIEYTTLPVAVLVDEHTASAGEMTAVSFKPLSNHKIFGNETAGYMSTNLAHIMPDQSVINLTNSLVCDHNKKVYKNMNVVPDVITNTPDKDALAWLKEQIKQ